VALLGGETAEMPGVYREGEVDLAGTIVGVVEKARIIDGSRIQAGDVVLGLASSGLHTNGFSLARKVFEGWDLMAHVPELGTTLGDALLAPHRPYLAEISTLWDAELFPTGLVHITGGGFVENPPRLFGADLQMVMDDFAWSPLFRLIAEVGKVPAAEMRRVFNLGVGLLVVVRAEDEARAKALVPELSRVGVMAARPEGGSAMVFK
jgi:phosphoribosylformylglycinamidine cyclo-ligase